MQIIRNILYDSLQTVITISFLLVLWVTMPFPWHVMMRTIAGWARVLKFLSRWVAGIDVRFKGLENVPDGPVVLASKHQSAWDTAVFLTVWPIACYVMKKELWSIPLWGWYARHCQSIPVDRAGGASALKGMLRTAKMRLEEGRHIVVFPEGTRVKPGENRKYHPGIAAIYQTVDVPVVPVALNSGLFWGRRSNGRKYPGTITVEFLPAIEPGIDRKVFMTRLKDEIDGATARLEAEALAQYPYLPRPKDEN